METTAAAAAPPPPEEEVDVAAVAMGQVTVYTPVEPADEHEDHAAQTDEAMLLYDETAVGVAEQAETMHDETEEKPSAEQKAVGAGQADVSLCEA